MVIDAAEKDEEQQASRKTGRSRQAPEKRMQSPKQDHR